MGDVEETKGWFGDSNNRSGGCSNTHESGGVGGCYQGSCMSLKQSFDFNKLKSPCTPQEHDIESEDLFSPCSPQEHDIKLQSPCSPQEHDIKSEDSFERTFDVGQLQGQGGTFRVANLDKSMMLNGNVELLKVIRIDLEEMVDENDFAAFDGLVDRANQIFGVLVDNKLLPRSVINMDTNKVLKEIKNSESKVSEIIDLIMEIEEEDPKDELLEELRDENLRKAEDKLKENKGSLLILQISNVVNHEIAITNASNPGTSV